MPDIGEDLAFNIFQLVQLVEWPPCSSDRNDPFCRERIRIDKPKAIAAVAHDQGLAVGGQAPALAAVSKFLLPAKSLKVVHEALPIQVCQLKEFPTKQCQAFSKNTVGKLHLLENAAGFQLDSS